MEVVVLGDLLVDELIDGDVTRVAPDAPVPVLAERKRSIYPGGAGLAAMLAVQESVSVTLICPLGEGDSPGQTVVSMLEERDVNVICVPTDVAVAVKTRIRSAGQVLFMIDSDPPIGDVEPPSAEVYSLLRTAAGLLISDYGSGMTSNLAWRAAIESVSQSVPIVWDPHPRGGSPVVGTTVTTPSSFDIGRFPPEAGLVGTPDDLEAARRLLSSPWGAPYVVVTRAAKGALMVTGSGHDPVIVPAFPISATSRFGAGDRFAAELMTLMATGESPEGALPRAVLAASLYVTSGVEKAHDGELAATLQQIAAAREQGKRIVATGGCFDLLHVGHVDLLQRASCLGDFLVVCLNSDSSVGRIKGPTRPVVSQDDRRRVLRSLASVDAVVIFDQDTPEKVIELLRPHVWVKGADYASHALPEQGVVETHGGRVVLLPLVPGRSTTELVHRASLE